MSYLTSHCRNVCRMTMIRLARSGMCGILFGAGALTTTGTTTQREFDDAARDSTNWLYVDHDYQGTRYCPLNQISGANAKQLGLICVCWRVQAFQW
jgi:hypothetical protein